MCITDVVGQDEDEPVRIDDTEATMETLSENAALFEQKSKLDPNVASIYSAVLPGLGQAYNGDLWKVPVIYAGGIVFLQLIKGKNRIYNIFRNALFNEIDDDENTVNPFKRFSTDALRRNTDQFRRDRDFYIILGLLWYGLNIVEAHISAQLDEFNVNDELSMRIYPSLIHVPTSPPGIGLSFILNIRG